MEENSDKTTAALIKIVGDLSAELHPLQPLSRPITLDSSLDHDLGLDSLARHELLGRMEHHFGVTLPERLFADAETPRDLLRIVVGTGTAKTVYPAGKITYSEVGDALAAPHSTQTLVEVLNWHVKAHPDRPHIRFYSDEEEGEVITYSQLKNGAGAVAAGLQDRGLDPGEPVAIMLPTGTEYFFSFFGILLAGGIPAPIYPPVRRSQIGDHLRRQRAILKNCGASLLITMPEARPFARLVKSHVETLRNLVTMEELISAKSYTSPPSGGGEVAFLQYTSGSTGNPKGVILTHGNLLTNIRTMGEVMEVDSTDLFVSWLPLYHDMGLIGAWLGSLYHAVQLVIMSPLSFIARPQRWLWAIHHYRATLSAAPDFAYGLCLKRVRDEEIKGLDLISWRAAFNGAEPVHPDTVERFCQRFEKYGFRREAFMPVYGLAECSVGLAIPPLGRGPLIDRVQREPLILHDRAIPADDANTEVFRFAACGRPLPGHEIRIVDSTGRELPERQQGRLQFRGPSACGGYFRNPEETRLLFKGDWLDSGDMAYIAGGDVYLTGRMKDMIIRAGRNIYPQEVEEVVGNLPGVRKGRVVVFGSMDADSGVERLVVMAETHINELEKRDYLRSEISAVATDLTGTPPDDIVLVMPGTLLKTSSGKIRRGASRQFYERGRINKGWRPAGWQILCFVMSGLGPALRRVRRNITGGLYAGYAWTVFGLAVFLVFLPVVLLPRLSWRWSVMRGMLRIAARLLCMPLSIQGLEHLPWGEPCVLVSNHASYLDSFAMTAALPQYLSFVAKAELAGRFALRFFLRRIRTEFVERFDKQKGIEDAHRLGQSIGGDRRLLFYPEGTITRMPGLLPFHMGAFVAAAEAGVPVVPIAIRGTRSILRSGSWFPRRGTITITIGKIIRLDEIKAVTGSDPWAAALKLREVAREHILRYCGEPDLARSFQRPSGGAADGQTFASIL